MAAANFNTPEHQIFNHQVVCLAGDGCSEGVAAEAASLGAHVGLDNLTTIYDSNDVTWMRCRRKPERKCFGPFALWF